MASTPDITDVVLPLPESATVPEVAAFSDAVDAPRAGAASTPARGAPSLAWTPRTNEQTKQGLDKDGSGTVDYTELQQVAAALPAQPTPGHSPSAVFASIFVEIRFA